MKTIMQRRNAHTLQGRVNRLVLWLAIIAIAWLASIILHNNAPQVRNMHAVDEWRAQADTQAAVTAFQEESGLTFKLFTYTGRQGCVGLLIEGESADRREEILVFVKSLDPPRPIHRVGVSTGGTASGISSEE